MQYLERKRKRCTGCGVALGVSSSPSEIESLTKSGEAFGVGDQGYSGDWARETNSDMLKKGRHHEVLRFCLPLYFTGVGGVVRACCCLDLA